MYMSKRLDWEDKREQGRGGGRGEEAHASYYPTAGLGRSMLRLKEGSQKGFFIVGIEDAGREAQEGKLYRRKTPYSLETTCQTVEAIRLPNSRPITLSTKVSVQHVRLA